jgi:hypothetical protein
MQRSFLFVIVTKHTSKIIITMNDCSYRGNFDLDKKNETITIAGKNTSSCKMSKIAKFGCELL